MRALQFWILLFGSFFVSGLLIKEIFLSRTIAQEHRVLVDSQETAASGPNWENAWKQVALRIYPLSLKDPALAEMLRSEKIEVSRVNPLTGAGSAPGTAPTPTPTPSAPAAPSKTPATP
jgi:hypothetical protein